MKVLSIRQPWAWAIVSGLKPVENRTWETRFRGDFLIHAGKRVDLEGIKFIRSLGISLPENLQTGGIIGWGEIIDCVDHYRSKWFFGPFGFVIKNAEPVDFIPLKGQLGFFNFSSQYIPMIK